MKGIFGARKDENGEWRRLHNEELHSMYRSPNIVRVIKCRRLRLAGNVARMDEFSSGPGFEPGSPALRADTLIY